VEGMGGRIVQRYRIFELALSGKADTPTPQRGVE
jgi:hypothetical protein